METNTSGRRCSPSELPLSAKKLSWGAFWFSLIWGIFNNTWRTFLVLILPGIMNIILLFKGRQWAWEHRKWDSEEQFDKAQKRWGMWGLIIFIIPVSAIVVNGAIAYYLIKATAPKTVIENSHKKTDVSHGIDVQQKFDNKLAETSNTESLPPITAIVNVIGTDGEHLLKASVGLILKDSYATDIKPSYDKNQPKLKRFLIEYLSKITLQDLQSKDIKNRVENDYLEHVKRIMPEYGKSFKNAQVTEFIIQ